MSGFNVLRSFVALGVLAFSLSGCLTDDNNNNNSSSDTVSAASTSIEGTAATGKAIDGFAYLRDALGTEINMPIGADGKFKFDTTGMQPPLIFRAIPNGGGDTEYSFSDILDGVVNLSPLTTLATFLAANQADLGTIFERWSSSSNAITREALESAIQTVNTNLDSQIRAEGLNPSTLDFVRTPFAVNGQGLDGVLDGVKVAVDFFTGSFSVQDRFNGFAPINFNLNPGAGNSGGDNAGGSNDGAGSGDNGSGDSTDNGGDSDTNSGTPPAISGTSLWKVTVTGTSTTNGFTVPINEVVLSDVPGSEVPDNPDDIDIDALLTDVTTGTNLSFSNVTSNLDTSNFDGTAGSKVFLDLAGTLSGNAQGFDFTNDFDYKYVFELINP